MIQRTLRFTIERMVRFQGEASRDEVLIDTHRAEVQEGLPPGWSIVGQEEVDVSTGPGSASVTQVSQSAHGRSIVQVARVGDGSSVVQVGGDILGGGWDRP